MTHVRVATRGLKVVETNGANVVQLFHVYYRLQGGDLGYGRSSPREDLPAHPGFAPQVEVCVKAHEHGSNGSAAFKHQDKRGIAEQEEANQELHGPAGKSIRPIIRFNCSITNQNGFSFAYLTR